MEIDGTKLIEYFKKIHPQPCALCGTNQWYAFGEAYYLNEFDYKPKHTPHRQFPVVPIVCPTCGNTFLVSAFVANLIDKEEATNGEK